jgi:hypothetical protein
MEVIVKKVRERSRMKGTIRVRLLPDGITEGEFVELWSKLTKKEKDRYTVFSCTNEITSAGKQNMLNYVGSTVMATGTSNFGAVIPFAVYFAVGTFPITNVFPGDVSVQGEIFRAQPSLATVSGYTVEISTLFGSTQANGTYTNSGLFGGSATGTSGSGTLMTHAMYPYAKANGQTVTNDYAINIQ